VNTSPAVGRLVADWILDGEPSIPGAEALHPARLGAAQSSGANRGM